MFDSLLLGSSFVKLDKKDILLGVRVNEKGQYEWTYYLPGSEDEMISEADYIKRENTSDLHRN